MMKTNVLFCFTQLLTVLPIYYFKKIPTLEHLYQIAHSLILTFLDKLSIIAI